MKIVGLQRLTLLDFPGRVACTVFLEGCNFRCPFCHNSQLLGCDAQALMEPAELISFLESRRGILDGVCITGGEPTLSQELPDLMRRIKSLGFQVKLDTNGYRPDVLKALVGEGLVDYVAMDVKNGPVRYAETAGMQHFHPERIEESIRFLLSGAVDYELRTTVAEPLHDETAISDMAKWLAELAGEHKILGLYLQPFVDRDTVPVAGLTAPDEKTLAKYCEILAGCAEKVEVRGK